MADGRKRGVAARIGSLRRPSRRRRLGMRAPRATGGSACGSGQRRGSGGNRDRGDHRAGRHRPPWEPSWETWRGGSGGQERRRRGRGGVRCRLRARTGSTGGMARSSGGSSVGTWRGRGIGCA